MTNEQDSLMAQIEHQRKVCARFPDDMVEAVALDTFIARLRDTFVVVEGSRRENRGRTPARGVLKLVG